MLRLRRYERISVQNWRLRFQGQMNNSRAPYSNVRQVPFSHTRSQDFLWRRTCFPKKLTTFLVVVVTFKPTLNVSKTFKRQSSMQRGKNLTADRGPLAAGPPPKVQPAQWLIRPCSLQRRPVYHTFR